jgi:formylglycine-generating enzyme required for sulfatase activity
MKYLVYLFLTFSFAESIAQASPGWDLQKVNDSLWMDAHETTLGDWFNFIHDELERGAGIDSVLALLPDTLLVPIRVADLTKIIRSTLQGEDQSSRWAGCKENITQYIVSDKVLRKSRKAKKGIFLFEYCKDKGEPGDLWEYPVTGISFGQVQAYLTWRNLVVHEAGAKWTFRLPSPEEWEMTAQLAHRKLLKAYPTQKEEYDRIYTSTGRNLHGCLLLNILNTSPCEYDLKYAKVESLEGLFPTDSFYPNGLGLLNLQGNVSEMTSKPGTAAGGNYLLGMTDAHFDSKQFYTRAEKWLGFRCVGQK